MAIASFSALVVAVVASVFDLRTRRIPNELTFGAALAAMSFQSATNGVEGFAVSLGGWMTGVAIFLPFYLLRGMGAGDVKLLGALGAWLGPTMVVWTGLYGAIVGGAFAVIAAVTYGYLGRALGNVWLLLTHWRTVGLVPVTELSIDSPDAPRLAYAVPIAAGLVVALWLR